MLNGSPTWRRRPQRDQQCRQTQRNGDHHCQRNEAPPTGDQLSELPLATAPGERNPDATGQPRLGGRDAERPLPRDPPNPISVLPMTVQPTLP
jgi:hypothetical protein